MRYALQNYDKKTMARVIGTNLTISRKTCRDIGVFIKNRKVEWVISYLEKVAEGTAPVPYARFNSKTPHHAPFGPSGYPKKASLEIINLLNSLKHGAQAKGLNTSKLVIIHAAAHKGARLFHPAGRERKNTHFELAATEMEEKKQASKQPAAKNEAKK
ncbi:MAG TPA: 50S ribosomal protein L22 [Nanoarchaeota archaeon]|nr:50S ribosomal protein L22P [uncultured archaeon]HIH14248.1 50S ribosomal protein L22 [Nanoarchaeota archaeon]